MIYDAEDQPEPDQLKQGRDRLPNGGDRPRLRAGRAQLLQRSRELADADVHARVLVLVRLHAARPRRAWACRSRSAARPTTSAPTACANWAAGTRSTSPRTPISASGRQRGLHGRRHQLDDLRGSELSGRQLDPPALALDQGLHADDSRPHAEPVRFIRNVGLKDGLGFALLIGGTLLTFLCTLPAGVCSLPGLDWPASRRPLSRHSAVRWPANLLLGNVLMVA